MNFDLRRIAEVSAKLLRLAKSIGRAPAEPLHLGAMRYRQLYKVADELDGLLNPNGLDQGQFDDILSASIRDEEKIALLALRVRFDRRFHLGLFRAWKLAEDQLDGTTNKFVAVQASSRVEATEVLVTVPHGPWIADFEGVVADFNELIMQKPQGDTGNRQSSSQALAACISARAQVKPPQLTSSYDQNVARLGIKVDEGGHQITRNSKSVKLTNVEYKIFATSLARDRWDLSGFLGKVWPGSSSGNLHNLKTTSRRLNKKLKDIGLKFDPQSRQIIELEESIPPHSKKQYCSKNGAL